MMTKDKKILWVFMIFAGLIVGLAIVGGIRTYSPVPVMDMWDGTIDFLLRYDEGSASLWEQHNEHRILLSRLLFFLDFKLFGGMSWFLIILNYVFVFIAFLVFRQFLHAMSATNKPETGEWLLTLMLLAWLFLWMQHINLIRGFQSQFFLAQLVPLGAFYGLYKSVVSRYSTASFVVACVLGVASTGTMANGIITLPIMVVYAMLTQQRVQHIFTLIVLSIVMLTLYFYDYISPPHHGSFIQALMEQPIDLLLYTMLYIGNPIYHLLGKSIFSALVAGISGIFLVISSAFFLIRVWRLLSPQMTALMYALLCFILYIGGTALGTGGSRVMFGIQQSLSHRYSTPPLMAWSALLILYSPYILTKLKMKITAEFLVCCAVLGILMLSHQIKAFNSYDNSIADKALAALALELGVKDEEQIKKIYPNASRVLNIAEKASAKDISIFGIYPFQGAKEQLGVIHQQQGKQVNCRGHLDDIKAISGETKFVRVRGWIFNHVEKTYPQLIRLLANNGEVVGYAITGIPRPDVAAVVDKKAILSGYQGYLLANQMSRPIQLMGDRVDCRIDEVVPNHY